MPGKEGAANRYQALFKGAEMNSRGEFGAFDIARKSIFWMIAGFFLAILLLAFFFLLGGQKERVTHIPSSLEAEVISWRFTQIADCFAYDDPLTFRVYPGIIDLAKFTQEQMDGCYPASAAAASSVFAFELELKETGKKLATANYYHVPTLTLRRAVLVEQNGQRTQDTLLIHVQVKGSGRRT